MTAPQDPFATPGEGANPPPPPAGYGPPPSYGAPAPGGYGTPAAPGGYGTAPAPGGYGAPAYGAPSDAWTGPPLASWGLRVGGYFIDAVIIIVITQILGAVSNSLGSLANLVLFIGFGYLTGVKGQTPGRQLVKISVVKESDGTFLGAGAGIGRAFLHILDALPLLLGFLWPIWDKKNQTFADKIIKSVVVKV